MELQTNPVDDSHTNSLTNAHMLAVDVTESDISNLLLETFPPNDPSLFLAYTSQNIHQHASEKETNDAFYVGDPTENYKHSLVTIVSADPMHISLDSTQSQSNNANALASNKSEERLLVEASPQIHQEKHYGTTPLACPMCHRKYKSKYFVTKHLKSDDGKKRACPVCGETFIYKCRLEEHFRTHKGEKPFTCEVCDKTFTTKYYRNFHVLTHSVEKPYVCEVCDEEFSYECILNNHFQANSLRKPIVCPVCGIKLATKNLLSWHLLSHNAKKS